MPYAFSQTDPCSSTAGFRVSLLAPRALQGPTEDTLVIMARSIVGFLCDSVVTVRLRELRHERHSLRRIFCRLSRWVIMNKIVWIGHVNEYPTMHYFGNPRHTQSMIGYMILTEYFVEIPIEKCIVGMLLTCPFCITLSLVVQQWGYIGTSHLPTSHLQWVPLNLPLSTYGLFTYAIPFLGFASFIILLKTYCYCAKCEGIVVFEFLTTSLRSHFSSPSWWKVRVCEAYLSL